MAFITPLLHELAGIVVCTAWAIVVDTIAVSKQWSPQVIGRWQLFEGKPVNNGRCEVRAVHGAGPE